MGKSLEQLQIRVVWQEKGHIAAYKVTYDIDGYVMSWLVTWSNVPKRILLAVRSPIIEHTGIFLPNIIRFL